MIPDELKDQFDQFLWYIAESLDISETYFTNAEKRYQAIGKWLEKEASAVVHSEPEIYPQGSFRLGTIIKPITDQEEYDIDLVCQLNLSKAVISQEKLKKLVGHEIIAYANANNMKSQPEEGRRCWTLKYASEALFHMDILPAIPDDDSFKLILHQLNVPRGLSDHAISITDNTSPNYKRIDNDWPRSNPIGYADWFKERMRKQYDYQRNIMARAIEARTDDVPEYKVKTPLQRTVQILKRHRDIMFADDQDDKPISIIITTLAAQAYDNEASLCEALMNIIGKMAYYIQNKNGVYWVSNPVNPLENFADKWQEYPNREKKFRKWLSQAQIDFGTALRSGNIQSLGEVIRPCIGDKAINEALKHFPQTGKTESTASLTMITKTPSFFDVPHREKPKWNMAIRSSVDIYGRYKYNGQWHAFQSNSTALPKHYDLLFTANTDVQKPFDVFWQVVNTGSEAELANGLRGQIFHSKTAGVGGLTQKESTLYTGSHWIECFIIKDGICVAKSGELIVNIL